MVVPKYPSYARDYIILFIAYVESLEETPWPVSIQCLMNHAEDTYPQIVYNTEQLSRPFVLRSCANIVRHDACREYWDYSEANLTMLRAEVPLIYHSKLMFKPLKISKDLIRGIQLSVQPYKTYDVGFVGTLTHRRKRLLDLLQAASVSVKVISDLSVRFHDQVKEMSQCKAILNLHAADDFKVFESHRCLPFLEAGIPVLTEVSLDTDTRCAVIFTEDTLVPCVTRYLASYK